MRLSATTGVACQLLVAAAVLLAACGRVAPGAGTPGRPPLRVAAYNWPGQFWVDVAKDQGWFQQAGLDVELVDGNTDYFASIKAFAAGDIDVHGPTLFDTILLNARGAEIVAIAVTDQSNGADGIGARPGITSIADLVGHRVALTQGTYSEYILGVVLGRLGRSLADLVVVDTPAEATGAKLADGSVDAIVTFEPTLRAATRAVHGQILWDSSELPGISPSLLATRATIVRERPDDLLKLLRVWHRATEFARQQPDEVFAIVARVYKTTPAEIRAMAALDRRLNLRENLRAFSFAAGLESLHGSARVMNEFLLKRQLVTRRLDSTDYLDGSFLKRLK